MNKNIFNYFLNQTEGGLEYIQASFIEAILIVNNEYGDSKWEYFIDVKEEEDMNPTIEVGYKGWEEPFSILLEYNPVNYQICVMELKGKASYTEERENALFNIIECGYGWFDPTSEDYYHLVEAIRDDWGQWRENN